MVVNLQGDLPALDPEQLKTVVAAWSKSGADIATLAAPIDNDADEANPAVVKAVVAWDAKERLGRALYFTRARAPAGDGALYHHVGLYAYRRAAWKVLSPCRLRPWRTRKAGAAAGRWKRDEHCGGACGRGAARPSILPPTSKRARKLLS